MASRFLAIGTAAALTAVVAVAAVSTLRHPHLRPSTAPGSAHLRVFGSRSVQQRQSARIAVEHLKLKSKKISAAYIAFGHGQDR